MSSPWASFTQDPRRPEAARLRASDRDRDVVLNVLAEAYADGRLRKDEHDERTAAATSAKFLGELATPLLDLVPASPVRPRDGLALATPEELRSRAVRRWQAQRRDALTGLLIPLLCWGIWYFASARHNAAPGFPWPVFVTFAIVVNVLRVQLQRADIVERELRRLERKQRKALGPPRRDEVTEA